MDAPWPRSWPNGQPPPPPVPSHDSDEPLDHRPAPDLDDRLPQARGAESPRLDAEVMLAHVLDWQRVQLYTHYEDEVGERSRGEFRDLVRRRAEGMPVAYLVGRKEFYSLPLRVTPAVLIPRPESEFVVVEFLALPSGSTPAAPSTSAPARAAWPSPAPTSTPRRGSWPSTSSRGPGCCRVEREGAQPGRPHRLPPGEPARAGRRRRPLRRDPLQSALHPHRRIPTLEPGVRPTSRTWRSTAARTASAWSPR